jgi:hypothetical protein
MAKTRGSDPENVDPTPGWLLTDKSPPIDGTKRSAMWDMNRVGVRELSYGGFFTLIAATDQPRLHRAAIALPSIVHIPLPASDFGGYFGRGVVSTRPDRLGPSGSWGRQARYETSFGDREEELVAQPRADWSSPRPARLRQGFGLPEGRTPPASAAGESGPFKGRPLGGG